MKKLIFFLLLALHGIGFAQIPTEYGQNDLQLIRDYVNGLKNQWDIVLDPIERMPTSPTAYELATGNWGADWLGVNRYHDEIVRRAERKVAVFIFDTAPFFNHPFLDGAVWNEKGKSYTGEDDLFDAQGHAHHVAGIIAARAENYVLGVARALAEKDLIKLIPREVLNDQGSGSFSWVAQAVQDANKEAVDLQRDGWFVIYNLSLGGPGTHTATDRALIEAKQLGVFVCTAAGNTYEEGVEFPGRSDGSHAIGSIDQDGRRSSFSSYGDELFMAAPGRNILSTWKNGTVAELSGTSMATPAEAAIVAITASIYPSMNANQIEELLISTATDIDPAGWDAQTGHGYNFIAQILNSEPPVEEPDTVLETRSRQTLGGIFSGPYEVIYQPGQGHFQPLLVRDLQIDFRTKLNSEDALEDLRVKIDSFFTNRAMVLTDKADGVRAGWWAGRFLEIYLKKEHGIRSDVKTLVVEDQHHNKGKPVIPGLFDYFRASRRTTFKY